MTISLDIDLVSAVDALTAALETSEANRVRQQQVIELFILRHAGRAGSRKNMLLVLNGIHKHVQQLINQLSEQEALSH
jgi:hypothetical protein